MDDTRARFLTAITGRVGEDRIVEVHLFSPIRQGVLETGVAMVVVTPDVAEAPADAVAGDTAMMSDGTDLAAEAAVAAESGDTTDAATVDAPADDAAVEADEAADADDDSPYADDEAEEAVAESAVVTDTTDAAAEQDVVDPGAAAPLASAVERHVLYTARYRLTRKGPDRGKWVFEMAATADAPLATADVVARGVTLRAKDVTETERLTGEQVRTLLQEPAWRTAP